MFVATALGAKGAKMAANTATKAIKNIANDKDTHGFLTNIAHSVVDDKIKNNIAKTIAHATIKSLSNNVTKKAGYLFGTYDDDDYASIKFLYKYLSNFCNKKQKTNNECLYFFLYLFPKYTCNNIECNDYDILQKETENICIAITLFYNILKQHRYTENCHILLFKSIMYTYEKKIAPLLTCS